MTGAGWTASFRRVNVAALIQLAASAIAVALMTGLAAWATHGRGAPALDVAEARRQLAAEFPGAALDGFWLAADGRGAVARSGDRALVLARIGDGYVARRIAWDAALAARVRDGRLSLPLGEPGAPRAVLAFEAWPPNGAAG